MKNLYQNAILGMALLASVAASGQTRNVGIGTTQPDQSAVLDIQSGSKGLLIPRMSLEERDKITNPANGLLIFQTNEKSGFYFYEKDTWKPLTANEAKAVQGDPNDWSLNGNATTSGTVTAATASSFIGTPAGVPLNFKIGGITAGQIPTTSNIFLGFRSGLALPSGSFNTGLGTSTLAALTTGSSNTAIGSRSLEKNTSGQLNLGIGGLSLNSNTTGNNNVAIGHGAMNKNIIGVDNVAIGKDVLFNSTGNFNIAIGSSVFVTKTSGNNNIGIGYLAGASNVSGSSNIFLGYAAGQNETSSNKLYIANSNTATPLIYGDFSAKYVTIGDVSPALRTQGVATGGYNLLVKGGILTEKVKVAIAQAGTDWADYVFEPSYKLMSLEEVETFTKENKHLPNVPSADEMMASGLDVAQTSKMFMEKIEELTLYMIELNKEVKTLKAENEVLKAKLK